MKKILIILLSVFLVSCGANVDNSNNTEKSIKNNVEKNDVSTKKEEDKNISSENNDLKENNNEDEKKVSFDEVKNNLEKLKDLNSDWLEELNSFILDLEKEKEISKIKKSWDIKKCNWLEKSSQDDCKREIIFSKKDINLCDKLSNTWAIISCKNEMNINIAFEKLDIKYCDKLIDNSKNKELIKDCRWEILYEVKKRKKEVK